MSCIDVESGRSCGYSFVTMLAENQNWLVKQSTIRKSMVIWFVSTKFGGRTLRINESCLKANNRSGNGSGGRYGNYHVVVEVEDMVVVVVVVELDMSTFI